MRTPIRRLVPPLGLIVLASCGAPPASQAPAAPPTPLPASSAPAPAASSASADAAPAPSSSPTASAPKPARKPSEILTQVDVTFLLAFPNSDPYAEAKRKCDEESDPAKVGPCMDRALDKVQAHAIRFTQDAQKNWWWHSLHKNRDQYLVLHKVMIEFGEETDKTIALKPKGRDQGMAPWGLLPKEVVIEVVDDYTIAMRDPQQGRLVFEARIGVMK